MPVFLKVLCVISIVVSLLTAGEIEELVKELGADEFMDREVAGQKLWEIGSPALKFVEAGAQSNDPEIRNRSEKLLVYLRAGVSSQWPEALQKEVLYSGSYTKDELKVLMDRLMENDPESAIPFLVIQLRGKSSAYAENLLHRQLDTENGIVLLGTLIPTPPQNKKETDLLFRIYVASGIFEDVKNAMGLPFLDRGQKEELTLEAVSYLNTLHEEKRFKELLEESATVSALFPDTAGFMYFEGLAHLDLGDDERGRALCDAALKLNPDDEWAHYKVAKVLAKTGHDFVAAREWYEVLRIPPGGGPNDINALFNIANYNQKIGELDQAADAYQNALIFMRQIREKGMQGKMGRGNEQELEALMKDLRSRALKAKMGKGAIEFEFGVLEKDDRMDALRERAEAAGFRMSMEVKPLGLRLLEIAPPTLLFNPEKEELVLMVNGKPSGKAVPYEWEDGHKHGANVVYFTSLDMRYFFEIDPETFEGAVVDKFELDFICKVVLNDKMKQLTDPQMMVNEKAYNQDEWEQGISLDYLPDELHLIYTGKNEEGFEVKGEVKVDPANSLPDFL